MHLAQTCERIAATTKKLEKTAIVADYLRSLELEDAVISAVFLSGGAFPAFEERTLQVGGSLLWKVVRDISGASDSELNAGYRKTGDLGAAVYHVLTDHGTRCQAVLTLREVREAFGQIAATRTANAKGEILRKLLERATPLETKYILKIITGDLRIGLKESLVEEAIAKVNAQVPLPPGYRFDWAGEYESQLRSERRLLVVIPITILLIFIILYSMFHSFKWALLILANVAMARIGGLLALLITGTNFSVSSGVGFLALFGVSVQTGVIMLEYINQLRARGHTVADAAVEGAILRLRPIMMTMLVATLGLLPAALSHGIGSDSQRPFAIVIVGGLVADLVMSIFLLPTLYVWIAGARDVLPEPEPAFDESE